MYEAAQAKADELDETVTDVVRRALERYTGKRGKSIADSGGRTQLSRVISLVDAGKSPQEIRAWCEKEIAKRSGGSDR